MFSLGQQLSEEQIKNLTLIEIERHMERNKRTLKDYKGFPYPYGFIVEQLGKRLIYDEMNYDLAVLRTEFLGLFRSLTGTICPYKAIQPYVLTELINISNLCPIFIFKHMSNVPFIRQSCHQLLARKVVCFSYTVMLEPVKRLCGELWQLQYVVNAKLF